MKELNALLKEIKGYKTKLHGKDFLLTWEKTTDELKQILAIADLLKMMREKNISAKLIGALNSGQTGLIAADVSRLKDEIARIISDTADAGQFIFFCQVAGIIFSQNPIYHHA